MRQPKLLAKIWAAIGLKNTIPESRGSGLAQGAATYDEGFPSITMTPITQGGKAPSGKDMNGILHELSAHIVHMNQGGHYKFDSGFAEKINGYNKGAVLINNDETAFFVSLVDQNKTDFNSGSDYADYWIKLADVEAIKQITPKDLTEESVSEKDHTGHTHRLPLASLIKKGIAKLYSGLDSNAEDMAATPKAIKRLKDLIDANIRNFGNFITNSKKSNAVDSASSDTVATSFAVKTLNNKIKFIYNIVKSNNIPVNLDFTSRDQIIAEMGGNYQGIGVYRFTFYNLVNHNITGLPLGDIKGAVAIELEIMGGFSRMSCQYLYANRLFYTHVDWNKPTLTLRWYEVLSQDGEGKVPRPITVNGAIETNRCVMVRRNSRTSSPYLLLLDDDVDLAGEIAARKLIGGIQFHAGKQGTTEGLLKGALRVNILTDKNAEIELSGKDANDAWKLFLMMMTATGNVIVGHRADNGRDRLQINGTVRANAPATHANNDQLPTTAWVNNALDKVRTVSRRDYSRTVRGTNANWDNGTSKSIAVTGSVEIYPDGKIVQYFYYRNFRVHWFDYEVAPREHFRVPEIPIQLWTAMPNKITYVSGHISRTNDTNIWPVRSAGAEATEWTTPLWAFEKQGNLKDRCSVYTRRLAGDANETVDMLIRVEGY